MNIIRAKALQNVEIPNVIFLEEGKEYIIEDTLVQMLEERNLIERVTENKESNHSEKKPRK